jgi:hypothetical protein
VGTPVIGVSIADARGAQRVWVRQADALFAGLCQGAFEVAGNLAKE